MRPGAQLGSISNTNVSSAQTASRKIKNLESPAQAVATASLHFDKLWPDIEPSKLIGENFGGPQSAPLELQTGNGGSTVLGQQNVVQDGLGVTRNRLLSLFSTFALTP